MEFTQEQHEGYMDQVIEVACQNLRRPFASLLVDAASGEVIATGLNKGHKNPTLHSEMMAIANALEKNHIIEWNNTVLYTTAEPGCMAMSGILWTGIPTVVYGCSMDRIHELGFRQIKIPATEVIERAPNLTCQLIPEVCKDKCDELFSAASKVNKL